ncbi:signal peptidase II [Leucobacter chromiireducens]|uniref:signal peptidase II n=1 Tax=Leucobacter chromiireducens TaxID=283877 RepID=UPI003F7F4D03
MNFVAHAAPGATASRPWRRLVPLVLFVVAIAVFTADQLVKNWVVATLPEGVTVPVLGDVLRWHFVRNPGAAFSLATGQTWIFTILAAAVVIVILWQIRRLRSLPWALFLGLLLGGVLGNLTDRLTREPGFPEGHVIDFISTPWMWLGFNEAIYNIADIGIVSGMILFIVITLLGLPIDGRSRAQARADEAAAEEAKLAAKAAESASAPETEASSTDSASDDSEGRGNATP